MSSDDEMIDSYSPKTEVNEADGAHFWNSPTGFRSPGEGSEDTNASAIQLAAQIESLQQEKLESNKARMRAVINRVFEDPFVKNRKVILLKSFMKWSKMLPLNLKCDELAKQLQDRIIAFSSLRDSYYRDVVSVKLHLSKVQSFQFGTDEGKTEVSSDVKAAKALQDDLYSVHSLPSINFTALLDRVRIQEQSSIQLQENLIQAGLINVTTGKSYNAWEKSKAFGMIMKQKKGVHYKMPQTEGESIIAAVPQTHELFVRYCKQCVGIMQFTRAWNSEVEDAMRLKALSNSMEKEISDLKFTVVSLSHITEQQETQIIKLTGENKRLVDASDWMGKWSYQQEAQEREDKFNDYIKHLKTGQGMLYADLESTAIVNSNRREAERERWALKESRLNHKLAKEAQEKDEEKHMRMVMLENLTISEQAGLEKDAIIASLRAEGGDQKSTIVSARESIASLIKSKEELQQSLDEWKDKYDKLKLMSEQDFDNLKYDFENCTRELSDKTELLDKQSNQIREAQAHLSTLQIRCNEMDEIKRKEAERQAWLASRPKYTLRVIAITIRAAVRLSRAIAAGPPFDGAGALGRRLQIRLLHESYVPALKELEAAKENVASLRHDLANAMKEVEQLIYKNNMTQTALATTREQAKGLQAICNELRLEIKAREADIATLNAGEVAYIKKIYQIKRVLHRARVSSHLQRGLTRTLSRNFTQMHAVLRSCAPETLPSLPQYVIDTDLAVKAAAATANAEDCSDVALVASAKDSVINDPVALEVDVPDVDPAKQQELDLIAKKARLVNLQGVLRKGFVAMVKWLKIMKIDRAFEGTSFKLPLSYLETLPPTAPCKEFDKQFKDTSKKIMAAFVEERKKLNRQVELGLMDARSVSTFASVSRQIIARLSQIVEVDLVECKRTIRRMQEAETLRLKKEAKALRKAEAKKRKDDEKLAKLKSRQESKKSLRASRVRGSVALTGGANTNDANSDAGSQQGESVENEGSQVIDEIASTRALKRATTAPQQASAYTPKNPGFMSMSFGQGGGGVPGGKAKQEVDLSFLDKPERVSVKRTPEAAESSDSDEDSEEDEDIPNAEMEMIDELEEEVQQLQLEKAHLAEELAESVSAGVRLQSQVESLQGIIEVQRVDLRSSQLDNEAAKNRIRLLRDAIEDNYRQRAAEIESLKRSVAEKEVAEVKAKKQARRHRGTQVACAVCAIRMHGTTPDDDNVGEHASLSSAVTALENFIEPLQGEFILVARPKNINAGNRKEHRPALAFTTHFSDEGGSDSKSLSQSVADPLAAHAQELAYAFASSGGKMNPNRSSGVLCDQRQIDAAAKNAVTRPSKSGVPPPSMTLGCSLNAVSESVHMPMPYAARPHTVGFESGDRRMYQPSEGGGYAHSRGHALDDSNAISSQHQSSRLSASVMANAKLPINSAAVGTRDAYEIRRTESNTAAFLQQQMLDGFQMGRPRSSIPSARAPAPPMDSLVHKRQLAPVPTRSQSASELINHLRRAVDQQNGGGKVSLVAMEKLHQSQSQSNFKKASNILTPSGTVINISSPNKSKKTKNWQFTEGAFEYHSGTSVIEDRPDLKERDEIIDLNEEV